MLKPYLSALYDGTIFSTEEAETLMDTIVEQNPNEIQIAALLSAFNTRPIAANELVGFRKSLLKRALSFDVDSDRLVDVCGTGGDTKNTINISTLNGFILAGAGYKVCKHGNFKFSSSLGSSDILQAFGVEFSNNPSQIQKSLDEANYAYIHAPLFHPSLKALAPIRKNLGVRTFINLLGPISNSLNPKYQLIGVYAPEIAELYAQTLNADAEKEYRIVYSLAGYDEISFTSDFTVTCPKKTKQYQTQDFEALFGFSAIKPEDICGASTPEESVKMFVSALKGENKKQAQCLIVNAAFALQMIDQCDIREAIEKAKQSLYSGEAYKKFVSFVEGNKK